MAHKLRMDASPDFTLTMDFDSFELAYGRSDDLTKFLDLARKLRDIKPSIDRIDVTTLGQNRLRLKISGGTTSWRADYEISALDGEEISDSDMTTWKHTELSAVHLIRDRILAMIQRHGLTDLKYTK